VTDILCLCTGNTCRSPMAAVLLAARLEERGVHVSSAGLITDGWPATDEGVAAMAARGFDTSSHRSRRMTARMLAEADLVVAMAREHVREAVGLEPGVWPRVFTLKELVRRGERVGPRSPDQPLGEWLAAVHDGRRTADLLGASPDDDVADPIGRPQAAYDATASELEELVTRLANLLG
jgi:protein-tyrosine-phosphatase